MARLRDRGRRRGGLCRSALMIRDGDGLLSLFLRWLRPILGVVGVGLWIFEFEHFLEDRGVDGPAHGLFFSTLLGLEEEKSDIGEGTGAARREAIGGERVEEFAENGVDVDLSDEIACRAFELRGEIFFVLRRMLGGVPSTSVSEAVAVPVGVSGKAAEAFIGKLELAKIEDIGWSGVGHGERIAKIY